MVIVALGEAPEADHFTGIFSALPQPRELPTLTSLVL